MNGLVKQIIITSASKRVLSKLVLSLSQSCRHHQSHLSSLQVFHVLVEIILAGDRYNISIGVIVPEFNSVNLKTKVGEDILSSFLKT